MNALARFEAFMQELMDRRVVRFLGGSLQPVELAHAIGRCLDGSLPGSVAPNRFHLLLNPSDAADVRTLDPSLEGKLARYAVELARERNLNFRQLPAVLILADPSIERGQVSVQAEVIADPRPPAVRRRARGSSPAAPAGRPSTVCFLEVRRPARTPARLPVDHLPFVIGRREGSDLVLADARVSRRHAVIEEENGHCRLRDLGSRNGSTVNGQTVAEAELRDGDLLAIGGFEMVVRFSEEA